TLRDAVAGWSQRHPQVRWELALSGELEGLGEALNITVYRIVQEALTNVVRHAEASCVRISVARESAARFEDALVVCVRDDGRGFGQAAAQENGRFGVAGMRERVQAFGGSCAICGSRKVLPCHTSRIAWIRASAALRLVRYPAAPALSTRRACIASSCADRTRMRASGSLARMRRTASRPPIPGMEMSITTTSGRASSMRRIASS